MDILDKIKESIYYVKDNTQYVEINYEVLDEIIKNINLENNTHWLISNPFGILNMNIKDIMYYLLILHTIGDYCFWGDPKWSIETSDGVFDGTYAIMYLILKRMQSKKCFNMTKSEFREFLKGNNEIPLLDDRYKNLCLMNKYLKGRNFYDLIKDKTKDTELLIYLIENLPYLEDVSLYKDKNIYFYKRAQLLVSDILHIREYIEKVRVDYSNLMGCADYKIPQVLNNLGVLIYNKDLDNKIMQRQELKENSEEEVEIRACDLVAIDYIYQKLNGKISRMDINDYLWLVGQDKKKIAKPYHRTLTSHY